jgi:hypothetical protein
MKRTEAAALREAWAGKPCDHPQLETEYHLGGQIGDAVCTTCGETFSRQKVLRMRLGAPTARARRGSNEGREG